MKLKEVFDQLTYGELSQLSIGGGEAGVISAANYDRVLSHVRLGLTELHKRFPLKEGRLILTLQANRTTYPINSSYAVSSTKSKEPVRYIADSTAAPFIDDIHKIERVYTADGFELGLNDDSDTYSLFTPSAFVLRVPSAIVNGSMDLPDELKTSTLEVVYRANHKILVTDEGDLDPEAVEVDLPYSHLAPLLLFVASRVHTPTGMTNEFNAGNNYAAKYEAACKDLETFNLRVDQGSQNTRLESNGWV